MHPSLLSLVVAFGVTAAGPQARSGAEVRFVPVHDAHLPVVPKAGGEVYYSRGGTFYVDAEGRLVNNADMALATIKQRVGTNEAIWEAVRLPGGDLQAPRASRKLAWRGNLDPFAPRLQFDPGRPESTANMTSQITVYDALGEARPLAVYFNAAEVENGLMVYRWVAITNPNLLQDPNVPPPAGATDTNATDANANDANRAVWAPDAFGRVGQGVVAFYANGTLAHVQSNTFLVRFVDVDQPQTLTLDFGKPVDLRHNGRGGLTAFPGVISAAQVSQDGYRTRSMAGVSEIDVNGLLTATLSDGTTAALDPLVMARFYNTFAMRAVADGVFAPTDASGPPNFAVAGCADIITEMVDGAANSAPQAPTVCEAGAQARQRIHADAQKWFVLEGEHAGKIGTYLAKEIDLRLIAGEPLQEAREGLRLQAVPPASIDGAIAAAGALTVPEPGDLLGPEMTTDIFILGNLDAANPPRAIDHYQLQNSANVSQQVRVYDHSGAAHHVRFDFYAQEQAPLPGGYHHHYVWLASFDPDPAAPEGTDEVDAAIGDGKLFFDPNGTLRAPAVATLELPLGPNGAMVAQTVHFGEPPDPNADVAQGPEHTASDPNAADPAVQDANIAVQNPNTLVAAPEPGVLTCLPRASVLRDSRQNGWQPGLGDVRYALDICGVLSVSLPNGEELTLGTMAVLPEGVPGSPVPLNDWLYALPAAQPGDIRSATCGDLSFDSAALGRGLQDLTHIVQKQGPAGPRRNALSER